MILLLTEHRDDPTIVILRDMLNQRGAEVMTIDTSTLERASISIPFAIEVPGERTIRPDDVSAALLWRASVPMLQDPMFDPIRNDEDSFRFVFAQWSKLSRGIWHGLEYSGVFCVNPATSVTMWEDKVTQLMAAREVGLTTPPTRFACDLAVAARFADEHGGRIVYKPFTPYFGRARVEGNYMTELYSQVLPASEIRSQADDRLIPTPGIFQPYVDKAYELRVVYVGGSIFTCRIESQQSEIANLDWRRYDMDNTPHLVHQLDAGVEKQITELMDRMNLHFGSLDFIVTPEGEHVFLEVNPVGQFDWIAKQTGLPIYDRLVELLIERG